MLLRDKCHLQDLNCTSDFPEKYRLRRPHKRLRSGVKRPGHKKILQGLWWITRAFDTTSIVTSFSSAVPLLMVLASVAWAVAACRVARNTLCFCLCCLYLCHQLTFSALIEQQWPSTHRMPALQFQRTPLRAESHPSVITQSD